MPAPVSRTQKRTSPPSMTEPTPISSSSLVCCTALRTRCTSACERRRRSATIEPPPRASRCQRLSASADACAITSSTRSSTANLWGTRKPRCSACARIERASAVRAAVSSPSTAAVRARLASSSSATVSGAPCSCDTDSRRRSASANVAARASSLFLVGYRAVCTRTRCDRRRDSAHEIPDQRRAREEHPGCDADCSPE